MTVHDFTVKVRKCATLDLSPLKGLKPEDPAALAPCIAALPEE